MTQTSSFCSSGVNDPNVFAMAENSVSTVNRIILRTDIQISIRASGNKNDQK